MKKFYKSIYKMFNKCNHNIFLRYLTTNVLLEKLKEKILK